MPWIIKTLHHNICACASHTNKVSLYFQVTVIFHWYPKMASSWNVPRCLLMSGTISDVLQKKLFQGIVPCFNKAALLALQQSNSLIPRGAHSQFFKILWSQRDFHVRGTLNKGYWPLALLLFFCKRRLSLGKPEGARSAQVHGTWGDPPTGPEGTGLSSSPSYLRSHGRPVKFPLMEKGGK